MVEDTETVVDLEVAMDIKFTYKEKKKCQEVMELGQAEQDPVVV